MKRPQVSTFYFATTMEDGAERGRGRGRLRIRGGGRVRGRGRAGRGVHGQRRQTLSNEIRAERETLKETKRSDEHMWM